MMDQLHNKLVGDQLADLLPREEEAAQFAHGLVDLLFVLDRYLFGCADVPYAVQGYAFYLLDVVEVVQSIGTEDEIDYHLGDFDSFGGL